MKTGQWVTNNPYEAQQLRRIDAAYEAAIKESINYPLTKKIEAHRIAKEKLFEGYGRVMAYAYIMEYGH
jgi:hypothetical protein